MDLWGSASDIFLQKNKYMLTIINQYIKQIWTKYQPDKRNVLTKIGS